MSKRLTIKEVYEIKRKYIEKYNQYSMCHYTQFNYDILSKAILKRYKAGRGDNKTTYNDIIIMCDTETSKSAENTTYYKKKSITDKDGNETIKNILTYNPVENYVVAWTISMRAFEMNIVTLYGNTPDEFCDCLELIQNALPGEETYFYWHNMAYDWVFVRKHMFKKFGHPDKQLNTKSHNPIMIRWENSHIVFRDSLILSQRSLEKWADDLNVAHKKAVGKWDYNAIRQQKGYFTRNELDYIECDTLAGVECINETMNALHKHIYSMPYTATGIPREEVRKIGKKHGARRSFLSMALDYDEYIKSTKVYHGGYTHANRYKIDEQITKVQTTCYDFSSSYPAVMLTEKYPMEHFMQYEDCSMIDIIKMSDNCAFMFKLIMVKPVLKDTHEPMPALQFSKCVKCINPVLDNGRILMADYIEIYLNEIDLKIIYSQYDYDRHICCEVEFATKDYLPRWFTDYVYQLYSDKCTLKHGDPVLYSIAKAKLNSLYGMCVQKSLKENIVENYVNGEYKNEQPIDPKTLEPLTEEQQYEKYLNNNNSVLPYQWGVWVTSYAMQNLFELSKCCIDERGDEPENCFVYSDTDSIYATYWNEEKLKAYNDGVIEKLKQNDYAPVIYNNEEFTPGKAEFDGTYSEFCVLGAKRYCCRYANDPRNKEKNRGKLKITVAGVPKSGVKCLNDNIKNFTSGFTFPGTETGKLTHHYMISDEIHDIDGNSAGDSVDLTPCDYLLSSIDVVDLDAMFEEEVQIQIYE